jgi:hypothetical protein
VNAQKAKMLSDAANAKKEDISGVLEYVHGRIEAAAKRGDRSTHRPWAGLRQMVSERMVEQIRESLIGDGYCITPNGTVSW